jgi:hypothetical protein
MIFQSDEASKLPLISKVVDQRFSKRDCPHSLVAGYAKDHKKHEKHFQTFESDIMNQ